VRIVSVDTCDNARNPCEELTQLTE
jgi:hypothetical protein